MDKGRRELYWVGSTKADLRAFPGNVQDSMGQALLDAQFGDTHPDAKPLKGFGGAGVLEIVDDYSGSTYRAIYTVRLKSGVYALHAFQKKATRGIKTPQHEIDLIKARLREAERQDAERMEAAESA